VSLFINLFVKVTGCGRPRVLYEAKAASGKSSGSFLCPEVPRVLSVVSARIERSVMHETRAQQPVAPIRARETDSGANHSRRLTLSAETPRTGNNFLRLHSHIPAKKERENVIWNQ
jgi:hypothetical protein